MPRKKRQISMTGVYHVVTRGADRQRMFEDSNDHQKYLDNLAYYSELLDFQIYAYCLMDNHVHLLIHTLTTPIDSIFRHINTAYSIWFNMKYSRTGFLFQGRYYSEPVEDIGYLLRAIRYIHQNPLMAGLETHVGASFKWSSYLDYKGRKDSLVDIAYITKLFGSEDAFFAYHTSKDDVECLDIHNVVTRLPDDVARAMILEECNCASVADFQKLSRIDQEKYLKILHQKGISIRQLNRLTGLTKGVLDRILCPPKKK